MPALTKKQKLKILERCKKSFVYFCENFCKIKHPSANIIPFKLFGYQKKSVKDFREHDRIIYRKCRQSGISTLTGAYSLWFALFYANKKVLIVSKRDEDAIGYLDRNVRFVYENLEFGEELFYPIFGDPRSPRNRKFPPPKTYNDHTLVFHNGSEIKSLTSAKDTLRSNSASLIIIDEAAFIPDMEAMWTGGQPTLMHGGRVIVISTTNGRGNWYCNTWEDAETGDNEFHPILIPWYDMDWEIEYYDEAFNRKVRIAPCDDIEKCSTEEEKAKYGEFKSPWLIRQYRDLQEKGEPWKFRQEILMEFIGAGNTVLGRDALLALAESIDNSCKILKQPVAYSNSSSGIDREYLDFQQCLWVWDMPVRRQPAVVKGDRVIKPVVNGNRYVVGVDVSTGEAKDWSAVQIIDVTNLEQAAELKIKVEMHQLSKMVDYLGRLYNNAMVIVERNGGYGESVLQDLKSVYYYPNIYYRRMPNGKKDAKPGFPTSAASKGHLVKAMCENMGVADGVSFKSSRLNKEANCFIHLGSGKVGNEAGTNNNDDLMIATGLALLAVLEAQQTPDGLIPTNSKNIDTSLEDNINLDIDDLVVKGGHKLLYPILTGSEDPGSQLSIEQEMSKFTSQIGGMSKEQTMKSGSLLDVTKKPKKYY